MRFILTLLQWFSKNQPDPDDKETKRAVLKLLLVDNFLVLLVAFWLGVSFAVYYPEAANDFLNLFDWLRALIGG